MSRSPLMFARHNGFVYRRLFCVLLALTVLLPLLAAMPGTAAAQSKAPQVRPIKPIPHRDAPLRAQQARTMPDPESTPATAWPSAGTAEVAVPAPTRPRSIDAAEGEPVPSARQRAGALPLSVASTRGAGKLKITMADPAAAQRAGVTGVLFAIEPVAPGVNSLSVALDYADFRNAVGAGFGSRLRLVRLPACAVTTPHVPACQVSTPLPSTNDPSARVVSADIAGAESMMVLAAVADSSGAGGSFEASSLGPSGSWAVTDNTGGFTWSYPVEIPPAASGTKVAPKIAIGYNSSAVDGRTAATNNQPSWLGQGWEYEPGYIERTYRSCGDDTTLPADQQTGDLCWAGQIVTMNLGGQTTALVYDDANHTWKAATDSGARIERLTGAVNGARDGEHWKITTTDGVQYYFGRNRGPGHTNQEEFGSTYTVPVYGPRSGDPCHSTAGFAQSKCDQAWRWSLDYVEDPHGNATAYYYAKESNHYGANLGTTGVSYTRGGTLKRIDYGLRNTGSGIYGGTVPAQVVFGVSERCIPTDTFSCDPSLFTAANASKWPDTPQDRECKLGATCNNHSPSFWTTKRLTSITTQYNTGSGPVKVDTYQLAHQFPTAADKELWLDSVTRTGHKDGATITVPPIRFAGQLFDNRVAGYNSQPAMAHWRITDITTDTGSLIKVTYSTPECTATSVPADPAHNTKRCYPVYWTLPRNKDPILDYFHKYVATQVSVQEPNSLSPKQITDYAYLGTPAWHYDDNELVKPKHRSYGQFRGYGQVEVRTGNPGHVHEESGATDGRTLSRTTYFRGMDGDTLPGGAKRSASVGNSLGESVPDDNRFASQPRETQLFNGDGGEQISTAVNDLAVIATTASRARPGLPPLTANIVRATKTRTIASLSGGRTRTTTEASRYDGTGRLVAKTDSGDGVPTLCATTRYADNTTSWIRDRVKEVLTSTQACPADGVDPSPVTAAVRTYYDGQSALGTITGPGNPTRVDTATANNGGTLTFATTGTATFDAAGRSKTTTDARGKTTTTTLTLTPADGGLLTKTAITNPKGQTSSVELEPARGKTIASTDVAGRRTDAVHDALGRLTGVWKPGQVKGSTPASATYEYLLRTDGPLAVTSRTMIDSGSGISEIKTVELRDAFGNVIQVQADAEDGGRIVKDTFYDSHGWARVTNNHYLATGAPSTTRIEVAPSAVRDRTIISFDGSGRVTSSTSYDGLNETSKTRTFHAGDSTTVIPPEGGVTTTTVTDARGRTTQLRRYSIPPTVSGTTISGGSYETTSYQFTATGLQDKVIDAVGNTWSYGYDFLGRKISQTDPDSGTSTTTYDLAGLTTSTTDGRGQKLSYVYDELGRKTAEYEGTVETGTKVASWVWDTATGGKGQLSHATRHTPTGNYVTGVTLYNGQGLPNKVVTQIPTSETGLTGLYTTTYGYTTTGLLNSIEPSAGGGLPGEVIGITYDKFGKPTTTTGYNAYVSATSYTPFGEPSQYTLGPSNNKAWLTYDYDAQTRRITGLNLSTQAAFGQVDDTRYHYDPAGNIVRSVNTQGPTGQAPVRTQCFDYDALNRLREAWTATDSCAGAPTTAAGTANVGGPVPYWTTWSFKPGGLRDKQFQHAVNSGGSDSTTTYHYPAPGAAQPHSLTGTTTEGPAGVTATTGYKYDPSGNTTERTVAGGTQELKWDASNRLRSVVNPAGTTAYVYDADGSQLIRRDPGKVTLLLPGQELTRDTATGVVTGTRFYTHNGTTVGMRVGNTNPKYVVSDLHSTATVMVESVGFAVTRRTMDPYGNPIGAVENGPWPGSRGFLDKPFSAATGLTDVGARKYDSSTGRFLSVDPVLDPTNPDQLCGYSYAENNPITRSDPSGLLTIVGVGEAGITEAMGMLRDLNALAPRSHKTLHYSITWGYVAIWAVPPGFVGPIANPWIYIPAVLIKIWYTSWASCDNPQPKPKGPSVGMPSTTRAEQAAWDRAHPQPRPQPAQKSLREQLRDLLVGLTGADKMVDCLRDWGIGDCVEGFLPYAVGPLAKGAVAVATRGSTRGVGSSVAISNSAGHAHQPYSVTKGGRADDQTVFAGHGSYVAGAGTTKVPAGTELRMYTFHGDELDDWDGLAIELGSSTAPAPVRVFGPGSRVPNYTLHPPHDLDIASGSYTVGESTQLSDLLIPDLGVCHWAACAVIE